MGLKISYVVVFQGKDEIGVPKDEDSKAIWKSLDPNIAMNEEGMEDVFWGPTGVSGPCGPTTEIYCKSADGKDIEIWNIVFNEFFCDGSREELLAGKAKLSPLKTKGIDTGMGLERLAMISQGKKSIFETDLFEPIIEFLNKNLSATRPDWSKRIISDHVRGIVFLIADGVSPDNKGQGYILRRLMRRVMPHLLEFQFFEPTSSGKPFEQFHSNGLRLIAKEFIARFKEFYPVLAEKEDYIFRVIDEENERFDKVYRNGEKVLQKIISQAMTSGSLGISGKEIFDLVTTHGFSLEWIKDKAKIYAIELDLKAFDEEFKKHQEISRAGAEKKFGGHGLVLDTGELKAGNEEDMQKVLRLHTVTHLLQAALREVLGNEVHQAGSDITPERTRFDFSFPRKMTPEEIKKTEDMVNEKIKEDLMVQFKEMPKEEAERIGALHFFKEKYPDPVKVYYVGRDLASAWSKEFCGGPHVAHTGEIGKVKIIKEEAVSAGVRRIRATIVE